MSKFGLGLAIQQGAGSNRDSITADASERVDAGVAIIAVCSNIDENERTAVK